MTDDDFDVDGHVDDDVPAVDTVVAIVFPIDLVDDSS